MYGLALDIGYSNFKMKHGELLSGKEPEVVIRPVGAAPVEQLAQNAMGVANDLIVTINGDRWATCVDPTRLESWSRELHKDYSQTDQYMALFYGALLIAGKKVIDVFTIGLPVHQYKDEEYRAKLKQLLEGDHKITPKTTISVRRVEIKPQAGGAYLSMIEQVQDNEDMLDVIEEGLILILDPGYFSTDWVVMMGGEFRYGSSDTSLQAMSRVLEKTSSLLRDDYGVAPDTAVLERSLRGGKRTIHILDSKVDFTAYMQQAANSVAKEALKELSSSMRGEGSSINLFGIVGGGADVFEPVVKEHFPKAHCVKINEPVLANVNGFWVACKLVAEREAEAS